MNGNGEKITHELKSLFESFYSHFVLRDLFGKIIPGSIFLFTVSLAIIESDNALSFYDYFKNIWIWIIFIGISWLIGFAIQGIGEVLKWIRYYPTHVEGQGSIELNQNKWFNLIIFFGEKATKSQKQGFERFVVIKEACGNGYLSLAFSVIFIWIVFLINNRTVGNTIFSIFVRNNLLIFILISFFTLIFIVFLRKMHFIHVDRQWEYMRESIKSWRNRESFQTKIKGKLPNELDNYFFPDE